MSDNLIITTTITIVIVIIIIVFAGEQVQRPGLPIGHKVSPQLPPRPEEHHGELLPGLTNHYDAGHLDAGYEGGVIIMVILGDPKEYFFETKHDDGENCINNVVGF